MGKQHDLREEQYPWPNQFAALVHSARIAKKLTLEELAEQVGLGRNRGKITTILRGNWPKHSTLLRVIEVLDISLEHVYPLPDMPTVGTLLETMRLRRGLRLDDVGAAIGISGTQIRRIERDLSPLSPSIAKLCIFYGVESVRTYEKSHLPLLSIELAEVIRQRGLSLADAASEAELDRMTLRLILRGHQPSLPVANKLEATFGLSPDLAQPFDPNSKLSEQLRVRQWHSGMGTRDFAREVGLSSSSYNTVVVNGAIGDQVHKALATSSLVTSEAAHQAKSRHVQRMLQQANVAVTTTSILGKYIDARCIDLGILPGIVARNIGIHPGVFRRIRRGRRPRQREIVEQIMDALCFTVDQREEVLSEWEAASA